MTDVTTSFVITRTIAATATDLWNVWTDPAAVVEFLHNERSTIDADTLELHARVGGRFRYDVVTEASGERTHIDGVYLDLEPFKRVQFSWTLPDTDPGDAPVVTVGLKELVTATDEVPLATTVTLTVSGVDGAPGDKSYYDGWSSALEQLARYFSVR